MKLEMGRKGFTLFELIVALAISAVIAVFVFSFSRSLATFWSESEDTAGLDIDVNIVLDQIAADLEAAVFLEGTGQSMFVVLAQSKQDVLGTFSWTGSRGSLRPESLDFAPERHRYGWAGCWLRFFSSSPDFNAISYQITRRPSASNHTVSRYLLCRTAVSQEDTLDAGFDLLNGSNYFASDTVATPAGQIKKPRLENMVLENVVDFGVRLYVKLGEEEDELPVYLPLDPEDDDYHPPSPPRGMRVVFPYYNVVDGDFIIDSEFRDYVGVTHSDEIGQYPDAVEVFIRVLDSEGAERLRAFEHDDVNDSFENIIDDHGRLYRRIVRILSEA